MSTTSAKIHDHRSIMADWAELLPELVQGIADCVLSTTDGGEVYMNMRAVCSSWRSAVAKPSPLAAIADLRFRPRHWVMLDLPFKNQDDDDVSLFLHVLTGRFHSLRLPVLHDHILVGASDGLLVLGDRDEPPNVACVLNPLTGDILRFAAPFHKSFEDIESTAVTGDSRLVLGGYAMVAWAAPTSDAFTEEDIGQSTTTMGTFQGNVYVVDLQSRVFKFLSPEEQCDAEVALIAEVPLNVDVYLSEEEEDNIGLSDYLVESAGELLLIRCHRGRALKVFRVDVERKSLEEVKSLGGCHALFLGPVRCMSVDAVNLPSVDSDCIYLLHWVGKSEHMSVYSLRDDKMEFISSVDNPDRPFSLVQVLLRYCDFLDE
ncbi:uncharacterized protein LOC124660140 [Lolium rigidum]|uniref:uncharacterized protein LOC124660140 n=1 Tax=Lolium rigidum TaxID=89674 RepID=UPI001F5C93CA|nr:uncharacterized protein LOC124660140 [Lolium rigidum]